MTLHQRSGPAMTDLRTELATLIASRICHDLISPVGAISNGLELVALGGAEPGGPEMALISESCDNANARIRFFRIAFGAASDTAMVSAGEIRGILAGLTAGSRLEVAWQGNDDLSRARVQRAFLALQCIETALRRGGRVEIAPGPERTIVSATSPHLDCDAALWRHLDPAAAPSGVLGSASGVAPAHVQFVLLPLLAADHGVRIEVAQGPEAVSLTV